MIDMFTFHEFGEVTSTQSIAKELLGQNKLTHSAIVTASSQTQGRGRYSRNWASPKGGLYLTMYLKPSQNIATWPEISYVVGISLCEAIRKIDLSCNPSLKWVNDVLINTKKVAGILLEVVPPDGILIGVGVNIKASKEIDQELGINLEKCSKNFSKDKLMETFLQRFKYNYNLWCEKGFGPIKTFWMRSAYGVGKEIEVKFRDYNQKGIFIGIDEAGRMQILDKGLVKYISAGEVYFN